MGDNGVIQLSSLREGRQFEINTFGYCPEEGYVPEYLEYGPSMWWTMYHQPEDYNPRNPTRGINEELFEGVKSLLPKKMRPFLNLYIGIGTSFDWWHGVDAFFFCDYTIVTMDATTDVTKRFKADIRIVPSRQVDREKGIVLPHGIDPDAGFVSKVLLGNLAECLEKKYQMSTRRK